MKRVAAAFALSIRRGFLIPVERESVEPLAPEACCRSAVASLKAEPLAPDLARVPSQAAPLLALLAAAMVNVSLLS
jgi:hypothetical protein